MTISLAAVFLPLVFMSGLMGRIFREFSITIIVSIFASGIVSLTLTPLMCARLLGKRGHGHEEDLDGARRSAASSSACSSVYGRSLWFFLRHRWVSALVWVVCLVGTVYLFYAVPEGVPAGRRQRVHASACSSAQEGTSPEQMHRYQDAASRASCRPNPSGRHDVHGERQRASSCRRTRDSLLAFLKDRLRAATAPIEPWSRAAAWRPIMRHDAGR